MRKADPTGRPRATLRHLILALLSLIVLAAALPARPAAAATKAIDINERIERVEISGLGQFYDGRGDTLQVETAAGEDGVTGRMVVKASVPGSNPSWYVFALRNTTERSIERWITAERYELIGSGIVWPDLDGRRIEAITPSLGYLPERVPNDRADVFRVTLEPGQTVTYAVELAGSRVGNLSAWTTLGYQLKVRERQLFNGVMLGITSVLGVFLTAIFAANHKAIFPSAALVAWCVLAYLCVDFGFWHKLLQLRPDDNSVWRAATEAAIAASLVIFLHTYLRLGAWHGFVRMLSGTWIVFQLALVLIAVIDPRLAATFARVSMVAIGGIGGLAILVLALGGQDRALALIPTWMLFLVWIFGTGMALVGRLHGDIVVSGLVAGLVVIIVLVGFTVTQFAFGSVEPSYAGTAGEQQLSALAVDGAGAAHWEWNVRRDEVKVGTDVEAWLGLKLGELSCKVDDFLRHVHPSDRERLRVAMLSAGGQSAGRFRVEFRMRHASNSYRWLDLSAGSVSGVDHRSQRFVGLLRDVTDARRAHERLISDAVHDSLTGLPNRALLVDRLKIAMAKARKDGSGRPVVALIDLDRFRSVNASFGIVVGDSLLMTLARRIARLLKEGDTLARVGGDQFAILLPEGLDASLLGRLIEDVRRSLRSPVTIAGQDIVVTGTLGVAVFDQSVADAEALLANAEIATHRAKGKGVDNVEVFRPDMRSGGHDDKERLARDLRKAIETGQLEVLYQPIIHLPTEELAGFEALVRWQHPEHGFLNPSDFVPMAEQSDLIVQLGSYVLARATKAAQRWHKELPRRENALFVAVNVSPRQLLHMELVQEVRQVLARTSLPASALRLEITEQLVMQNPEQASEMLDTLRATGVRLALDDFGTGYSSLAYLQRFPFDTIKIDRDLVQDVASGGAGAAIVRSIVALAHELGKKVVAEGVEDAAEVGFLRSIACEYAQGFYYGEAMSERDALQLLRIVRKSERKLQRRGLFRTKVGQQDAPAGANGEGQAAPDGRARSSKGGGGAAGNGATPDAGRGRAAALPSSTIRPRGRAPAGGSDDQRPPDMPPGPDRPQVPRSMSGPPPIPQARPLVTQAMPGPGSSGEPRSVPPPLRPVVPPPMPPPVDTSGRPVQPPGEGGASAGDADWPTPPPVVQMPWHRPGSGAADLPAGQSVFRKTAPERGAQTAHPAATSARPRPASVLRTTTRPRQPIPDLSSLPPAIARSLARLAGAPSAPEPGQPPEPPDDSGPGTGDRSRHPGKSAAE